MARDWRTAMLAALVAAMLGGACVLGGAVAAFAQQAEEEDEPEEAKAQTKAKKKQDPAEAQRVVDAALKQLQAGKTAEAVQAASAAMAAGNLPPAIMAKALYVRGAAYRRQGRPAQAISDLSAALWLKGGLGGDEREDAMKEKAAAYADAGLADPGAVQPPRKTAEGGGGNWLSGLFGGLGGDPPSPPPKKVERAEPPPASEKVALGSAWSSETDVRTPPPTSPAPKAKAPPPKAPQAPPKTAKAPPEPPPSSAKKAEGRFLVQLAAMRTQAEALALAAKAKREHAALLASRSQSIDRQVFGNMGAFYRVRFGPFASAQETQAVCARLQSSGIDCLPVVNQ